MPNKKKSQETANLMLNRKNKKQPFITTNQLFHVFDRNRKIMKDMEKPNTNVTK